jgi:opacity protein-like surface antigen
MNRTPLASGFVAVLSLLAAAAPSAADIGAGNGEIGFDVGFTEFDSNTSDDTGTRGAVRGGYHFTDLFQLEGQVAVMNADDGVDVQLTTVMVDAVFNFHPSPNVVPYVLVGAGTANLDLEIFGISIDDDSTAYQAALGTRFFPGSGPLAIRLEASALWEDTFDVDSTHYSAVVGLTWRLGP